MHSDPDALKQKYESDYEAGQDNVQWFGMDLHKGVFIVSAALIALFVTTTLLYPKLSGEWLGSAKTWSINHFDWLFMLSCNLFVLFCLALIFLPVGRLRLGGEDARPEYSTLSWLAMLFAAGMGIGLMFWSVAEPIAYYTDWYGTPLNVEPNSPEAARLAMGSTLYHWGLHPWAIYGVVGLSLAFFCYNKGLPLTIRSAFYPLLGEKVWSWRGDIIDILAVLATVFGLATSLGLGAQQATSGLHFLFDTPDTLATQIFLIFCITVIASFSVVRGMDAGVKLLSNINMLLAAALLLIVLILGPTLEILGWVGSTLSSYASNILSLSNWVGREDDTWFHGWTVFYWAWWISWSPFVGLFIARISRGRSVREFLIAVLLVPSAVTLLWMSVFGGSALEQAMAGTGELANGISKVSLSMFQMLEQMPLTEICSFIAVALVLMFFITSSDSGSLVVDSLTSGGKLDSPVPQRLFWASTEGLIASALLIGGGKDALKALQAGAITTGLPFTIVLVLMCVSLYKGLHTELTVQRLTGRH